MQKRSNVAKLIGELHAASPAGFAVALHIAYATPTFLFQSYPKEWMEEYSARGLHLQDPNVAWGFANSGAIRWNELRDQDPAGVIDAAGRHGMTHGFAWSILKDGTRTIAGLSRSDREFTDAEIARIGEILTALHDDTAGTDSLDEADREALKEMSIRLTHA